MRIKLYPEKILKKKTKPITDEKIKELYEELVASMISYDGLGLAAPQIGIGKSIAVVSEKVDEGLDNPILLINPEIIECSGKQSMVEGCLSISGVTSEIPRYESVKVETGSRNNRKIIVAHGLLSIVLQHEIDHLNGILILDRLKIHKMIIKKIKARINKRNAEKS